MGTVVERKKALRPPFRFSLSDLGVQLVSPPWSHLGSDPVSSRLVLKYRSLSVCRANLC